MWRRVVGVVVLVALLLLGGFWLQAPVASKAPTHKPKTVLVQPELPAADEGPANAPTAAPAIAPTDPTTPGTLICHVAGDTPVVLRAMSPKPREIQETTGVGDLTLSLRPGVWAVWWSPVGAAVASRPFFNRNQTAAGVFTITAGEAQTCEITPLVTRVSGLVTDPDGAPLPGAEVKGCGVGAETDGNGRFEAVISSIEPCYLAAYWRDGLLQRSGDPLSLLPSGDDLEVTLWVDPRPIAGIGVGIDAGPRVLVTNVLPGGPADRAGIEAGDMILSVDGETTEGMDIDDFVNLCTGPDGTEVTLAVAGAVGTDVLTLIRQRFSDDPPAQIAAADGPIPEEWEEGQVSDEAGAEEILPEDLPSDDSPDPSEGQGPPDTGDTAGPLEP